MHFSNDLMVSHDDITCTISIHDGLPTAKRGMCHDSRVHICSKSHMLFTSQNVVFYYFQLKKSLQVRWAGLLFF